MWSLTVADDFWGFFLYAMEQIIRVDFPLTHSQTTNFRLFQIERVCRRQFQIRNGGKFSKRVENTVGKGVIARKEQFLLFP